MDKDYFLNVARLAYFYTNEMKEHHLIDEMVIDNTPDMVNPFYGRVEKDSAYVVEYSRGVPSMIYSPYGAYQIPAAKFCRGYLDDYRAFHKSVNAKLRQKEIEPIIENSMEMVSPRYVICEMPWLSKEKLPTEFKPHTIVSTDYIIGSKEEKERLENIFNANNHYFRAIGHPELVHMQPEEKQSVVKPVESKEPKKRTCIIFGQIKSMLKNPLKGKGTEKGF